MNRNKIKLAAFIFWATIVFGFFYYKVTNDLSFLDIVKNILDIIINSYFGPLIFIIIYAFRPVIFFPATILTVLAGVLFGFWWGVLCVFVGENFSASFAYFLGKYFGADILEKKGGKNNFLKKWKKRLQENSFQTVLIMRFIYLPFDLTNFTCGILKIKWRQYFAATFIGIIPGVLTFVSLGASIENIESLNLSEISISSTQVLVSFVIFSISLAIAKFLKKC